MLRFEDCFEIHLLCIDGRIFYFEICCVIFRMLTMLHMVRAAIHCANKHSVTQYLGSKQTSEVGRP